MRTQSRGPRTTGGRVLCYSRQAGRSSWEWAAHAEGSGDGGMHWEAVCGGTFFASVYAASWSRGQWCARYAWVIGEGLDLFLFVYGPSLWKKDDMNQQQAGVLGRDPLPAGTLVRSRTLHAQRHESAQGQPHSPAVATETFTPQVHWETTLLTRPDSQPLQKSL